LDNTLGIFFDAAVIGAALYGAACMQTWYYYRKYRSRDNWKIKSLVALVMLLDTGHVLTISACVYTYLVTHHDDPAVVGSVFQTLIIEIILNTMIAIVVQMFYVHKIYKLCDRRWYQWPLTALVGGLALAGFAVYNTYVGKSLYYVSFLEIAHLKSLSIACNALAAATDFSISLVLVFLLRSSKSGLKKTNDMIARLVMFTFNTGIPTSACAVMSLICINVFPDTFIYIFFFLLLSRFYTNSLMALLNSRNYVRNGGQEQESYSLSFDAPRKAPINDTHISIHMNTVKETDVSDCDVEAGDKANSLA